MLSGIWHGANWTFVVWGGLHATYQIFGLITLRFRTFIVSLLRIKKFTFLSILSTFLMVNFAWIFFRAKDLKTAFDYIHRLFSKFSNLLYEIKQGNSVVENLGLPNNEIFLCFVLIGGMEFFHLFIRKFDLKIRFKNSPFYLRWSVYLTFIISVIFFGVYEEREFIYFQF